MEHTGQNLSFRIFILIATHKLTKKAEKMLHTAGVPAFYRVAAKGTATNDMMDILGLGGVDKTMLVSMLPETFANEMMKKLKKDLKLGTVNSGIAFTLPLSGSNHQLLRMMQQIGNTSEITEMQDAKETLAKPDVQTAQPERKKERMETDYTLIAAIIDQGYSDAVIDAAREVGAKGGTVIHSRRAGSETAQILWGLSLQEEKEIVLIAADKEQKLTIMKAIGEKCGMRTDAHGVIMSVPIDSVIGLSE